MNDLTIYSSWILFHSCRKHTNRSITWLVGVQCLPIKYWFVFFVGPKSINFLLVKTTIFLTAIYYVVHFSLIFRYFIDIPTIDWLMFHLRHLYTMKEVNSHWWDHMTVVLLFLFYFVMVFFPFFMLSWLYVYLVFLCWFCFVLCPYEYLYDC